VSFPASERTTFLAFIQGGSAPTSTDDAQTLSALARQCQDIIDLEGHRALKRSLRFSLGCMIAAVLQAVILCGDQALPIQR
jgi:hypothetical protein